MEIVLKFTQKDGKVVENRFAKDKKQIMASLHGADAIDLSELSACVNLDTPINE